MSLISTNRKSDRHFIDLNTHKDVCFPSDLRLIRKKKKSCTKDKESFIPTENIFFSLVTDPERKHIKKHFTTCLLQAQKAEMVSRENKTESLFLLTIALSYKISLNPKPPVTVEFSLSFSRSLARSLLKGKQALLLGLIGCRLMLSNNIPVP